LHLEAPGYLPLASERVPADAQIGTRVLAKTSTTHSRAQLADFQGDLMLWAPTLALTCDASGADPRSGMRCTGDLGPPRGLLAGWVWELTVPAYHEASDRELFYQAALRAGHTHYALHVAECHSGNGYHGITPQSPEDCASNGDRLNRSLREIGAHGLIRVCLGVSFEAPPDPTLDRTLCDIAADDWDNRAEKDCNLEALAAAFPGIPLYIEQPTGSLPRPDRCTPPGLLPARDGGAWLRSVQQRFPMFRGVFHESDRNGVDEDAAVLRDVEHPFFRDVQEVQFESDTFQKFFGNLDFSEAKGYNDQLLARLPWLTGYFSGASPHGPPGTDPVPVGDALLRPGDMVPIDQVQFIAGPNLGSWPQTTTITQLDVTLTGVRAVFDKADGPTRWPDNTTPGWTGTLQYSLGVAFQIGGTWYASAPIEFWYGLPENGGPIQQPGQLPREWFYASRWAPMNGYQPQAGELIGVFVVAGDTRNGFSPLQERSNVVLVPMPAAGVAATFTQAH
jgi:hypothetical protein